MTVVVVIMVIILTFVAMGYKLDKDGELSQNGLVQISTQPTGATVTLDGDTLFARTNTSRSLSAGKHTVSLTRSGYDTWEKTITIKSGWLYKLDYPRLFKLERETETVLEFKEGLEFLSMSTDRNNILYAEKGSAKWVWLRVRGDEAEKHEIDIAELFGLTEGFTGEIREIVWSGSGDRVLVDWADGTTHLNIAVNLARPENSVNLTREFGMDFSRVRPASNSADKLYVTEGGNLRSISLGNKEISRILVTNVADFDNLESKVLFVTGVDEAGIQTIGYYADGDKTPIVLETVAGDGVKLAISEYLDEEYLTIAVGPEVSVYKVEDLTEEKKIEDLTREEQATFAAAPAELKVYNRGRLVMAREGTKVLMFDMEQGQFVEYELESEPEGWLDGFLIANVADGKLIARDFDGENRRELVAAVSGYQAMVAANEKFLYYMGECGESDSGGEKSLCLQRDKL